MSAQNSTSQGDIDPEVENELLSNYLFYIIASVTSALTCWRLYTEAAKYLRRLACLNNDSQRYFALTSYKTAFLKRNILYSPLFRKRHNREFQLSSAVNFGTLPTRLQLVFILGYFATNVIFCVIDTPWRTGSFGQVCSILRNRTGTLSVVNMIPLFVMAGRNNPLIRALNISFDTFNLLHRWFGRIVILEAVAHTLAFLAGSASRSSWSQAIQTTLKVPFLMYGFIATCVFVFLGIQASSILRHAFYESFKLLHIALAALSIVGLWYHLRLDDLPQIKWLIPVIPIWIADRLCRVLRVVYRNIGAGGSRTLVEALPGNTCRVTITMARPWNFKPGQHAYLYMPAIGWWQSHPFSVAWSDEADDLSSEKLPANRGDILARKKSSMSFVIRARTGFTDTLHKKAAACPNGRLVTTCYAEGPYGGRHMMHSYGTVMLFAGGVGITQAVPHVRDLVASHSNGTVATRKIVLVWIIQSPEHLEWIRPWMTEILAMEKRREVLRILLFVSRPRSTKEIHSPSATVQMFPGRPNIETLLGMELDQQVGAMGVSVCGPGSLSDEVRQAVRNRQYSGTIDFVEEAFTW